jgi:uncharacterized protein YdiU (UPF0061 family)
MAAELGVEEGPRGVGSSAFLRILSGNLSPLEPPDACRAWATPYAVSVAGQEITAPDPFGRGNGYGDGRALCLAEVETAAGGRWELQLKGCGTTPFSRKHDGRSVLRSSVREFVASEAMHAMRVPTTRALSLVASESAYVDRAWYGDDDRGARDHQPDTHVRERCAITCRAAPSFLRVGHLELWARRAARGEAGGLEGLRSLAEYAMRREFGEIARGEAPLAQRIVSMVREFAARQSALATHWLRVGYVQGNYNSDNCLLSGRTMDYGPFGFMERFEPRWNPFTGDPGGGNYGFERQPEAAQVNVLTLARALIPLLESLPGGAELIPAVQRAVKQEFEEVSARDLEQMRREKLGLAPVGGAAADSREVEGLWTGLATLLQRTPADYTLAFRQLCQIGDEDARAAAAYGGGRLAPSGSARGWLTAAAPPLGRYTEPALEPALACGGCTEEAAAAEPSPTEPSAEQAAAEQAAAEQAAAEQAAAEQAASRLVELMRPAFYSKQSAGDDAAWRRWLAAYSARLVADGRGEAARRPAMRAANPKYVPREWMLAAAYRAAEAGDHEPLHELTRLLASPYEEQPELEPKYYRRTPMNMRRKCGISFFS